MSNLTRFPFKSMISIVNFMNNKGYESESKINDIQNASNACYPDTLEIIGMLAYLTSFGQVKNSLDGWSISFGQNLLNKMAFREHFLKDIVKIIHSLSHDAKNIHSLAENLEGLEEQMIKDNLEFLEKITAFGFIRKGSKGWELVKYDTVQEIQA